MKRIITLLLCVVLAFGCLAACDKDPSYASPNGNRIDFSSGKHHVIITVENYGKIELELDADTAPITVENFCTLAADGFYDGLTFHRIIENFMIQGGDPDHNGTGGNKDKNGNEINIKGEFSANGVRNNISHKRGVISMARANPYDSASSQFFIVHQDSPHLDGQYAAFGYVTKGMDVVDAIAVNTPVVDSNGTVLYQNQPVIKSIKVVD